MNWLEKYEIQVCFKVRVTLLYPLYNDATIAR